MDNVVGFRELSKIARAEQTKADRGHAVEAVVRLVRQSSYSIKDAYADTVQAAYEERDVAARVRTIIKKLEAFRSGRRLSADLRAALAQLRSEIGRLLDEQK